MPEQGWTTKDTDAEAAVLEKIAAWPDAYRAIGERLHRTILDAVPALRPKLWYGMPGYHTGGPVLCFFRADALMSFGLTEKAHVAVADGAADRLMPSAWFLETLDDATERRVAQIVRGAAG
ncbi:DUF1801 domain-containing protein [Patulibacter sp. S7RM1-6]